MAEHRVREFDVTDDTCRAPECTRNRTPKPASGPQSLYCSRSCRDKATYPQRQERLAKERAQEAARRLAERGATTCPHCAVEFVPERTAQQLYCSARCRSASTRDSRVAMCSVEACDRPMRAKGLCNSHYKAQSPNRAAWSKGRRETRRANLRRKTQLRRARLSGDLAAEVIDRNDVGDRDAWLCGLCAEVVDADLLWPDPLSASLDHVVPLSLGGKHVLTNVQISHLRCNVAKGNRVPIAPMRGAA